VTTALTDASTVRDRSAGDRLTALRQAGEPATGGVFGSAGSSFERAGGGPPDAATGPPDARTADTRPRSRSTGPPGGARVETTAPLPVVGGEPPRWFARFGERWLPASWRGARLDPGRPGAVVLVGVALAAALLAVFAVWRDRPVAEPAPALAVVESAEPPSARPRPPGGPMVVSVVGKVRRPGLVRVTDGARVADAIAEAGGPLRGVDLTPLNLARRVADGEQILVGLPQPPVPPGSAVSGPGGTTGAGTPDVPGSGKVDLNRASLEQLDTLPGVGPVTAQRILDWRTRHGRFSSVDQLREIEGIGERRFAQIKEQVSW
jgi:competence protein ComEA